MTIPRFQLTDEYSISRVIKGSWHLAGGHGSIDTREAIEDMRAFVEAGITTFDCADIYTGVEELIGKFLNKYREPIRAGDLAPVQVHTKYVPDHNALKDLKPRDTIQIIDRSLMRLGVQQLDLVQYCWWDFGVPGYIETALVLQELQKEGKIRYIGVTNIDREHLEELLGAGIDVISNQVQYSVIDHRPETDLATLRIPLLCFGVLAGGFLSEQYLDAPAPPEPLKNRSLIKYRLIIEEFGGCHAFQELLKILVSIGGKHHVSISDVAARYIIQKPLAASLIIGARNRDHLEKYNRIFSFELDETDLENIRQVTEQAKGPKGPVYELERDRKGPHGRIMRYNLNQQRA